LPVEKLLSLTLQGKIKVPHVDMVLFYSNLSRGEP